MFFFETNKVSAEDHRSWLFRRPVASLVCGAGDDCRVFFHVLEKWMAQGYWLAGWFSYEFFQMLDPCLRGLGWESASSPRHLARIHVFAAPMVHDHDHQADIFLTQPGCPPETDSAGTPLTDGYTLETPRPLMEKEAYLEALRAIKRYIVDGHTYQVNFTTALAFGLSGSPVGLYLDLRRNQSVSHAAYLKTGEETLLSLSPELFFKVKDGAIVARPMKGTAKRGLTPEEDEKKAGALAQDPKNRSENLMIVDLIRNDLGRICEQGSVRAAPLCEVETYETLHQMTSTVRGRLRRPFAPDTADGGYLFSLFSALFPCGSVTGAPKIRTMEIIRELETRPRGVYCGAIGFVAPTGDCVFSVPIRTVALERGRGLMGIGSGIVHESDPEQEWQECLLKADFLTRPRPEFQLIETLLWRPDTGYWLFDLHLERLARSAAYFLYPCDKSDIAARLEQVAVECAEFPDVAHRVRLLLCRDGDITVTHARCDDAALPELVTAEAVLGPGFQEGVPRKRVLWASDPVEANDPFLYHKTTLRRRYDADRSRAIDHGFFEVLYANANGEVTEGAISNLFVRRGEKLLTPPVRCGLLAGVFRRFLLENFPDRVSEQVMTREEVAEADMVCMGNSVRGLVPVRVEG